MGAILDRQDSPIEGAAVTSQSGAGYGSVSNTLGHYRIDNIPNGTYTIRVLRYGYKDTAISGIVLNFADNDTAYMDIIMQGYLITVKGSVSASGVPKSGRKTASLDGIGVGIPEQSIYTTTNASGEYTLSGVSPEALYIVAAKSGIGWGKTALGASGSGNVSGLNIQLSETGGRITGTVRLSNGNIKAGAVVKAMGGGLSDTTDNEGYFTLTDVPVGFPMEVKEDTNSLASGLEVNQNCELIGLNLSPQLLHGNGNAVIGNAKYYVPDTGSTLIYANVISGKNNICGFLWDLDGNGGFDTLTSGSMIRVFGNSASQSIGYSVALAQGDTLEMATIEMNRVSQKPAAKVKTIVSAQPNELVEFIDSTVCLWGGASSYQWDFDGDGYYDFINPYSNKVQRRFPQSGVYTPKFVVSNNLGQKDSATFTLTVSGATISLPSTDLIPPRVTSPAPTDTIIGSSFKLTWTSAAAGAVYDIYMNAFSPPESVKAGSVSDTFCTITGCVENTAYFIKVKAKKGDSTAFSLSTRVNIGKNHPPIFTYNSFYPSDHDSVSGDSIFLLWSAYDLDNHSITYDVYFGTDDTPSLTADNLAKTSIRISPAAGFINNQEYTWKIVASDSLDSTVSTIRHIRYLTNLFNLAPVFLNLIGDMNPAANIGYTYKEIGRAHV
jgi:hypothetical protein